MEGTFPCALFANALWRRVIFWSFSARRKRSRSRIGSNAVWSAADSGNGNLLLAQIAKLAQAATIQSLSFYVTAASGNLILGIYDASGPNGGPGALKASTASFTPTTGWNTAKVVTPVSLPAGTYWLAYLPSSNALGFRENQRDRQLRILQLQFWQPAEQVQHLAGEL